MRRTALIALLVLALVAVLCPMAVAQTATPSPEPPSGGGATTGGFGFAILVIGILVAIAVPTFLGARARAQDKAAQSSLRNGLVAGKVYFTDADTYSGFDPEEGALIEPSLSWIGDEPPAGPTTVAIADVSGTELLLVSRSETGDFFCIYDDAAEGTYYGMGPTYRSVDSPRECSGPAWV